MYALGIETNTGTKVIIKLSEPGAMAESLEMEYRNYVLLGAEGTHHYMEKYLN